DSFHLNLGYTRSAFQTPHSFDSAALDEDQHTLINTYNIAPSWTHLFGNSKLLNLGMYVRHDSFHYFPSQDPFVDQPETLEQKRRLTNVGGRADFSYVKGAHNLKIGGMYQHTLLDERFNLGLTDPTLNSPCIDA